MCDRDGSIVEKQVKKKETEMANRLVRNRRVQIRGFQTAGRESPEASATDIRTLKTGTKLSGLSRQVNYTDRGTAACRRS
jgi:hypothetical protein